MELKQLKSVELKQLKSVELKQFKSVELKQLKSVELKQFKYNFKQNKVNVTLINSNESFKYRVNEQLKKSYFPLFRVCNCN